MDEGDSGDDILSSAETNQDKRKLHEVPNILALDYLGCCMSRSQGQLPSPRPNV